MKTIEVFLYSELVDKKAKQKAKDWILRGIQETRPWIDDYRKLRKVCGEKSREELLEIAENDEGQEACPLTGFCADSIVLKAIREARPSYELTEDDLKQIAFKAIDRAWEDEQSSWETDEYINEDAEHHEYYFTKNGIPIGSKL